MPSSKPQPLERAMPLLQNAINWVRQNPGKLYTVADKVTPEQAVLLTTKLRALRKGLAMHEPPGSELHNMGDARLLKIYTQYDRAVPYLRTVTVEYLGPVKPPSEMNREEILRALGFSQSTIN